MATAKDIVLKPIDAHSANDFVRKHHYSGKSAINAYIHFGAFLNDRLEGVMQFGPSLDKRRIQGLVRDTGWNDFVELNRMAFSEALPRNSESRALSIAMRLMRKHAPHIKWVISFADGTRCGDGTIYRASGFVLTGITENKTMWRLPDGFVFADIGLRASSADLRKRVGYNLGEPFSIFAKRVGAQRVEGFQLRYIYFIDPTYRARLTVPELPFSEIERRGAAMYKGEKITRARADVETGGISNVDTGGANPTRALHPEMQDG